MTVIGIDAHKRTHTLVAIDSGGRKLAQKTVSATSSGHAEAIQWATTRFGTDLTWAVEDNRSVTGLLERDLLAGGPWPVKRCPPHLMARSRVSARERGKSDPIDALAVARVVLREPNLPVAFHDPVSWELKLLVDRREDLVGQRVAVMNRLFWRLHQIDPGRPEPKRLQHAVRREALADYLGEQSGVAGRAGTRGSGRSLPVQCEHRRADRADSPPCKGSRVHPADGAGVRGIDCG